MLRLQEEGVAALSDTTVKGAHCLRVAITNHRTCRSDIDLMVARVRDIAKALSSPESAS